MPKRFSTARGREFGAGLRSTLKRANLSGRAAAEILTWDEAKLSDLANGKGGSTRVDVAMLLGVCRTPPDECKHLLTLFPETSTRDWWQQHGTSAPIRSRTFAENLAAATALIDWQTHVVPDLLQTAAYARAVIRASSTLPADELEARVEARLELQQAIGRGLACTFFIHEYALQLPVGDPEVHAEQVHHLLRMAVRSNVDIRILPARAGAHAGLRGPFTQLTFPKYEPLVWVEIENSSLVIENSPAIQGYLAVVRSLERACLDTTRSKARLIELGQRGARQRLTRTA